MSEFTQGEWKRFLYEHGGSRIYGGPEDRDLIADTYEPKGNADLLFASLDMYNALKEEMKEWDSCNHPSFRVMELIQDAIDKAEGKE